MAGKEILAEQFEAHRGHLRSVALRMLGSRNEADDAVQETYLRLTRADASHVENFGGWLTTIVARVCLDMLRARQTRREVPIDATAENVPVEFDAEREKQIADSVGVAMLVVLQTLTPSERVAFVLHDLFGVSFDEIAPVLGRSSAAARQLASRGRRRVQGGAPALEADRARQREVVAAFLAASRGGDFAALLAILDPDVVLRADAATIQVNAARAANAPQLAPEMRGRDTVANVFGNRLRAAVPALVDGYSGLVFAQGGRATVVMDFVVEDGRVREVSMTAEPERVAAFKLEF
jgi:RNA polymerase sigma-70 factor (ECF subfamily)